MPTEPPRDGEIPSRSLRWLLVTGDRLSVAGIFLAVIFSILVLLAGVGFLSGRPSSPMYFLFSAFLGGNFTLITIVLSINQLVLSRELGAPGDLHQRIEEALEYRKNVEENIGQSATPVKPGEFLLFLHETAGERTDELRDQVANTTDSHLQERVETFADNILTDIKAVTRTLDAETIQIFTAIEATLGTNHATQIRDIDQIQVNFDNLLSDDQQDLLSEIRMNLLHIDIARKYFRTVYMEKELSFLSRVILYVGVPAEVTSVIVLVIYGSVKTTPLTAAWLDLLVPVALSVGFAPLAVLFSFILRLSWVAQRNASVAPFTASDEGYRF